jgi:heat shock protein HslJ
MRTYRFALGLAFVFLGIYAQAQAKWQLITVTGQLTRAMGIGGESTGWMIQLDAETAIDGKQVHSIEVAYRDVSSLDKLANQRVKATGKLSHRRGVETGERTILEITSIKEFKESSQQGHGEQGLGSTSAFSLSGSEWVLEELSGSGVLDQVQATLAFPEAGKTAGNGGCNRFFGAAEIHGETIKLGPLGSTRMACPEAVMHQETKYLEALHAAERFEWKDPYLLIYCKDFGRPLRFTRVAAH